MSKIKIGLQESDECTTINLSLSILISDLSQTKLMSQLAYQAQVVTFNIRTDLVFKHGEGAQIEKGYP